MWSRIEQRRDRKMHAAIPLAVQYGADAPLRAPQAALRARRWCSKSGVNMHQQRVAMEQRGGVLGNRKHIGRGLKIGPRAPGDRIRICPGAGSGFRKRAAWGGHENSETMDVQLFTGCGLMCQNMHRRHPRLDGGATPI